MSLYDWVWGVCEGVWYLLPGLECHPALLMTELAGQSPTSEVLSPRGGMVVEGTWLQLMCCTLPKHLCP